MKIRSLQWELPFGIFAFHSAARNCLLFRCDAEPLQLTPTEALRMLEGKPAGAMCFVLAAAPEGIEVAHLELEGAVGDRSSQRRQRTYLDRILRALISKYDVAFWKTE